MVNDILIKKKKLYKKRKETCQNKNRKKYIFLLSLYIPLLRVYVDSPTRLINSSDNGSVPVQHLQLPSPSVACTK